MVLRAAMSDEKPDPLSDVIRGLGLLLRAAKTTVERVPTKGLEQAVAETAREVGRAIENVAEVFEREVFRGSGRSGEPREPREPRDDGAPGAPGSADGPSSSPEAADRKPHEPRDPPT